MRWLLALPLLFPSCALFEWVEDHPATVDAFAELVDDGSAIGAHYATSDEFPSDLIAHALGVALEAVSAYLVEEGGEPLPINQEDLVPALTTLLQSLVDAE